MPKTSRLDPLFLIELHDPAAHVARAEAGGFVLGSIREEARKSNLAAG
ncbi:hypothetical protein [Kitasatospora sp. GP30]|nr:hypothetical protein [Kitasatospora sp. GP30]